MGPLAVRLKFRRGLTHSVQTTFGIRKYKPLSADLTSVSVGASVGHGQHAGLGVFELEIFVGKLLAIDGFATFAGPKARGGARVKGKVVNC